MKKKLSKIEQTIVDIARNSSNPEDIKHLYRCDEHGIFANKITAQCPRCKVFCPRFDVPDVGPTIIKMDTLHLATAIYSLSQIKDPTIREFIAEPKAFLKKLKYEIDKELDK